MQKFYTEKTSWLSFSHPRMVFSSILVFAFISAIGPVQADDRTQAKRIHDRLTGVVPTATVLDEMVDFIDGTTPIAGSKYPNAASGEIAAAYVAMENKHFYNATLVNFVTPWTNEARSVFPGDMGTEGILNDYTATVVGIIRDDIDFRKILYEDILYVGVNAGLPAYSHTSNAHYKALEESGDDLGQASVLMEVKQSSIPGVTPKLAAPDTAGIITTRAGAKAFFVEGTNRAMFRFTVLNHLCQDMEQLKDNTLPADRIRQDVSRSPGGDSRIFMNTCIGCHTGMDPMTQAFAYYDYDFPLDGNGDPIYQNGQLVFNGVGVNDTDRDGNDTGTNSRVQLKNLINPDNFKPGYIVPDDKWVNYWRQGKNYLLGWNSTPLSGNTGEGTGAKSMAQELAYTDAFARCQVEKVFKAVCLRPPGNTADRAAVDNILSNFSPDYKLKQVFAETAVYCKGP